MKKEFRAAIKAGIMESDQMGHKWAVTPTGLRWSYLDTSFTFAVVEREDYTMLTVKDAYTNDTMVNVFVGTNDLLCDCSDLTEAYRMATKATIRKANYLY